LLLVSSTTLLGPPVIEGGGDLRGVVEEGTVDCLESLSCGANDWPELMVDSRTLC
jgi:hypothetical protein